MSPRQKRLERVSEHRTKELDRRVAELLRQKAREEAAQRAAEAERRELSRAEQQRSELSARELSARDWIEVNEWLRKRSAQAALADSEARKAELGTQRARAHVLHARTDLKKIEVLSTRIEHEERVRNERGERRLQDELSARRFTSESRREGEE